MGPVDPNSPPLCFKELYLAIRPKDKNPLGFPSKEAATVLHLSSQLGFSLSPERRLELQQFLTGPTPHPDARTHPNNIPNANSACAVLVAMVFQFIRHTVEYISLYIEADILHDVRTFMSDANINSASQQYEDGKPFPHIKLFAWRSSLLHPQGSKISLDRAVNFVTWAKIWAFEIYGTIHPEVCRVFQYTQEALHGSCITNLNLRDTFMFYHDLNRFINHLPNVVHFSLNLDHDLVDADEATELVEPLPSHVINCLQPLARKLQSLTLVIVGTDNTACGIDDLVSTLSWFRSLRKLCIVKMQFSITAIILGLAAVSSAAIADVEGVRNVERNSIVLDARQAKKATGACCIPNTSLKQDACTDAAGAAGKCVPGGPTACGGALNCVATTSLACDNSVKERSGVLCRFKLPNGKLQDGVNQITSLSQAKVN
ncbi:hypothetical protein CGLO_17552 [Colletotrichum gloeosporioides Cg-14]|uniref:Uncharacterized protein n=3 Tax=Colletotrichum gloeosporioides species complex TaxID=2707338 RepID=T0JKQ6_COLGC|nr:hypothetical protein CGLO_17552 [Colletotrichum gloeosporioides Cg-14]